MLIVTVFNPFYYIMQLFYHSPVTHFFLFVQIAHRNYFAFHLIYFVNYTCVKKFSRDFIYDNYNGVNVLLNLC